jgi:hypothetical protein
MLCWSHSANVFMRALLVILQFVFEGIPLMLLEVVNFRVRNGIIRGAEDAMTIGGVIMCLNLPLVVV